MPFCSSSNTSNILFALPSQFGWQYDSNRLFTNNTLAMSLDSWWPAANYYLSVIPFLTAVDVGIIPHESFRIIKYEHFYSNSSDCSHQVAKRPMWSAYIASINDALSLVESKTVFLPSNLERLFGYVWARLINLIGMSRKNINLSETIKNQRAFLPRRMLLDSDRSK
ncbi:unnamed protein product [Rotaria magnacalcarata]|uniref:Uncharacterized protein n=1 Tax=Rotaria magnacalcarata TaxID=392030 RepID=A0A814I838_9BILA|nr:unnamed protein product [Rotaria magnacalcarata]CAF1283795.1 unnamed protein product [Rotaria magnacalcarata]CAF3877674.1 unnamed protein product [Rotaria magnacalcarata]CAF3936486.1 unnamed protein product [Rotaria magnacalcarata]